MNDNVTCAVFFPRVMTQFVDIAKYWAGALTKTVAAILGVRDHDVYKRRQSPEYIGISRRIGSDEIVRC